MIVCICNNVNSDSIHASIDNGACSVDAIRNDTGAASCCGKCQFKVNRILHDRQQAEAQTLLSAAEAAYS
jgi:bacterioferritin-associated ferredoxin